MIPPNFSKNFPDFKKTFPIPEPKILKALKIPLVSGNIFFKACISPPNLKWLPNFKSQANVLVSGPVTNLFVNPIDKLKIAIAPITFIIPDINFGWVLAKFPKD